MNTSAHRVWIGLFSGERIALVRVRLGQTVAADQRRTTSGPIDPAIQRAEIISELSEIKQLLKE